MARPRLRPSANQIPDNGIIYASDEYRINGLSLISERIEWSSTGQYFVDEMRHPVNKWYFAQNISVGSTNLHDGCDCINSILYGKKNCVRFYYYFSHFVLVPRNRQNFIFSTNTSVVFMCRHNYHLLSSG